MTRIGAVKQRNRYILECYGPTGNKKWEESSHNIVVNAGLDHSLSIITASAHITNWFVGLTATAAVFAGADTMGSHAGWVEVQAYSEGVRQTYTAGGISAQSVSNTAAKAAFSINAATTVGGAFMCDNNTKGGGTGLLYGGATIAARIVANGDTVNVTITCGAEVT